MTGLWDVAFALALAMLMLLALDWRIQKAFQNHEVREEKLHATAILLAEGAVGPGHRATCATSTSCGSRRTRSGSTCRTSPSWCASTRLDYPTRR